MRPGRELNLTHKSNHGYLSFRKDLTTTGTFPLWNFSVMELRKSRGKVKGAKDTKEKERI
jgi:hypothetical protein